MKYNLFTSLARKITLPCAVMLLSGLARAQTNATPPLDKSQYNLLNPTPTNAMRPFDTDRPSKTDVPFTVDAGHFQLEMDFANFTHDEEAGVRTETIEAGSTMNLKVGLFNNTDFQVILGNYVHEEITDKNLHTQTTYEGFGDVTPRLKVNLFGNDSGTFCLALLPYVKIPTDTGGVGNHSFEGGLNVPFAANLPAGFVLNAETGVGAFRNDDDLGYHAAFNNSVVLYHTLYEKLTGYTEFFSSVSSRSRDPWIGTVDFGLVYQLLPNLSLDIDTAIGVTRSAPDYNVFAGFGFRL